MQTEAEIDLPDTPPTMPLGKLIGGLLLRPRATFAETFGEMTQSGKMWLVVALVALVLAGAASFLNTSAIMQRASSVAPPTSFGPAGGSGVVVQSGPGQQPIESQGAAPAGAQLSAMAGIGAAVGAAISMVVGWFVWAVGLLIGGTLTGGRSTFGNIFKMTILAALPLILRNFVQVVALAFGAPPIVNAGFAGFLPMEPGALTILARGILGSLDLFQLWNLVMLAVGASVVSRMSMRKASILVIVIGLLLVMLGALPAMLLGSFSTGA